MNHNITRVRMLPSLEQRSNYSQAVRVGDTVHVSATFALDDQGRLVSDVNMAMQIRQAYRNLEATLARFGGSLRDVVSETVHVTSLEQARLTDQLWQVYPAETAPARTLVEVQALAVPTAMIAVSCIAVLQP